jgi:hypothetical protein
MENIIEIVIRIFIYKFDHIWREWMSAIGGEQIRKSPNISPLNETEILYRSHNFLVLNKRHDVVINSDDPTVQVSYMLSEWYCLLVMHMLQFLYTNKTHHIYKSYAVSIVQ